MTVLIRFTVVRKDSTKPSALLLHLQNPFRAGLPATAFWRTDPPGGRLSFIFLTILMSGINMYAMAVVMKVMLGWDIHVSIWISSLTVGLYVALGGLVSAIFNEVLQFFLIWLGALMIPILGMVEAGGWSGLVARIHQIFQEATTPTCGGPWPTLRITPWACTGRALSLDC